MAEVYLFDVNDVWEPLSRCWSASSSTAGFDLRRWSTDSVRTTSANYLDALAFVRNELSGHAVILVHLGITSVNCTPAVEQIIRGFQQEANSKLPQQFQDYTLAPTQTSWSGLVLVKEALLNAKWQGVILSTTSAGNIDQAREAFERWRNQLGAAGTEFNDGVTLEWRYGNFDHAVYDKKLMPHVGVALDAFRRRFGRPLEKMRGRLQALKNPHTAVVNLRENGSVVSDIVDGIKDMLCFHDDPFAEILGDQVTPENVQNLKRVFADVISGIGIEGLNRDFTTVSAWFVALAAFRQAWPALMWGDYFDVRQVLECTSHPPTIGPHQSVSARRATADRCFEMFQLLFKKDRCQTESAIRAVVLEQGGALRFDLGWDFTVRENGPNSLFGNLQHWWGRSVEGEALLEKDEKGERKEYHTTSLAIWKFRSASSMGDDRDKGMFHCACRMNLRRVSGTPMMTRLEFKALEQGG